MNGHGNTGYGGYFVNTDTGADANYGIYASNASASGYGGYFTNTSTGWALAATGTSTFNGSVGIGLSNPTEQFQVYNSGGATTISIGSEATGKTYSDFYTSATQMVILVFRVLLRAAQVMEISF